MTAKTYVRHDREVLYDDPEWIPVPMRRQVLARIYEIRGVVNGIPVIEHEMTARNQADALQRLRDRYRRLHDVEFETGEVTPLAFAELRFQYKHDVKRRLVPDGQTHAVCWMAPIDDSDASEPPIDLPDYLRDRWHVCELDYDRHWAKPFAAAARRLAAGKPIEMRELTGSPPRTIAGWPFALVRKVLRQDKGKGFELPGDSLDRAGDSWTSIFPFEFVQELPNLLTRLKALGLVMQDRVTYTVTAKGRRLCALSQSRITRQRALKVIDDLVERIKSINDNPTYCYKIAVAVAFGSSLDAAKDKVGDVDIAHKMAPRVDGQKFEALRAAATARCPESQAQTFLGHLAWPDTEVVRALTQSARGILQVRGIDELAHLFETERKVPTYRVLHGSWTPPMRKRRRANR